MIPRPANSSITGFTGSKKTSVTWPSLTRSAPTWMIDNNLTDFNIEVRTRGYERSIMGTHGILELAPFIDAGKVFDDAAENPISPLHPVGGLGFRGIAEPFVVGYVDIGWGSRGPVFFSGINYPF